MFETFRKWYRRYLFEEEAVLLLVLLTIGLVLMLTLGDVLAPILAAIVLAYLMEGIGQYLTDRGLPQWIGFTLSFLVFLGLFFGVLLLLLPLVWQQWLALIDNLPTMLEAGRGVLERLLETSGLATLGIVPAELLDEAFQLSKEQVQGFTREFLSLSAGTIPDLLLLTVYVVLMPLLVFFLLKDREQILGWMVSFLPAKRPLLNRIWAEMDQQVSNYARGKLIEIIIVGSVSYVAFALFGLNYAALLALLVGLSVIIPYIGAIVVTVPIALVAALQWGATDISTFYWVMFTYLVIQALDGNLLVPLLFSEAVSLHPAAIICAVLFFGGIWGMWGVFFAIPLATLVKAVINAWPRPGDDQHNAQDNIQNNIQNNAPNNT